MASIELPFGGRYQPTEVLRRGGIVQTFKGVDLESRAPVVIKSAPPDAVSNGAKLRLEYEASQLQRLSGRGLASLHAIGIDNSEGIYVVTRFVDGVSLERRLERGPLSIQEALDVGLGLFRALASAHAVGILHRDIKPSNIILNAESTDEFVTLIDFGLASSTALRFPVETQLVGSAKYMAPEHAGLIEHAYGEYSDLYSAGVVLFECLLGKPPFDGESVNEILHNQVSLPVPRLKPLRSDVPTALCTIIERLLAKAPEARYQKALAVLDDLEELEALRLIGEDDPDISIGLSDLRQTLAEAPLVGRHHQVKQVDALLAKTRSGNGGMISVMAESGGGATRFLEEISVRWAVAGFSIYRGQGVYQTVPRPAQTLAYAVNKLCNEARTDDALASHVRNHLTPNTKELCQLFPELDHILPTSESHLADAEYSEPRQQAALAKLVMTMGRATRPAALILDDCQWADEITVKFLEYWHRFIATSDEPIYTTVIIVARPDAVAASAILSDLYSPPARALNLAPLTAEESEALIRSMTGRVDREIVDLVFKIARGNPFMTTSLLQGTVESGVLRPGRNGWEIDAIKACAIQSSSEAASVLLSQMMSVPERTEDVLAMGATLGREFSADDIAAISGYERDQVVEALVVAKVKHFVWEDTERRYTFTHDRLRERFLKSLSPKAVKELHRRIGQLLKSRDPLDVYALAYHYYEAGLSTEALPFALQAAIEARSRGALDVAEQMYQIAMEGLASDRSEQRFQVAHAFGETLFFRGKNQEAKEILEQSRALDPPAEILADINILMAEGAIRKSDLDSARKELEASLATMNETLPRARLMLLVQLSREFMIRLLFALGLWRGRNRKTAKLRADRVTIEAYHRLSFIYYFKQGRIAALYANLKAMNLAERFAPDRQLAAIYTSHVPLVSLMPWPKRALRYANRALAIQTQLDNTPGIAHAKIYVGLAYIVGCRFRAAVDVLSSAIEVIEQTGLLWELGIARQFRSICLLRLGELGRALEEAQGIHANGVKDGAYHAAVLPLSTWAEAGLGQIPKSVIDVWLRQPVTDGQALALLHLADAIRLHTLGCFQKARLSLELGEKAARRGRAVNLFTAPIFSWQARIALDEAQNFTQLSGYQRSRALKRATKATRTALWKAMWYPQTLPQTLRCLGILAAAKKRYGLATRYFAWSVRVAQRHEAFYEEALSLLAQAELRRDLGHQGAKDEVIRAKALVDAIELQVTSRNTTHRWGTETKPLTISLIDRYDNLLRWGRKIASGIDQESIYRDVVQATKSLLRSDCNIVLALGAEQEDPRDAVPVAGDLKAPFDRAVLREAITAGHAIIAEENHATGNVEHDLSASFAQRSALCAPISVKGRIHACIYVSHSKITRLYGNDERRVADLITAVAGAALESAGLYGKLAEANRLKDDFLASLSHELRTPVAVIHGWIEMLVAGQVRPDGLAKAYLSIQRNVKREIQLIEDILDISNILNGQLKLSYQEMDLAAVVHQARESMEAEAREKGIMIRINHPPPITMRGDPKRIMQSVTSLLSNAVKFTPRAGKVCLTLEAKDGQASIKVEDTGIGISSHFLPHVFERFRQEDGSITRLHGGLGIGLAVASHIVKRHGGSIHVSSPGRNQGATFEILLPIEQG